MDIAPLIPFEPAGLPERIAASVPAFVPTDSELLSTSKAIGFVASDQDYTLMLKLAGNLASEQRQADKHYKPYADMANKLHDRIVAMRDGIVGQYRSEITRLKNMALAYDAEKERKAREEAARREAEARRVAEAERQRIIAEARRQAEEQEAKRREAEAAAALERNEQRRLAMQKEAARQALEAAATIERARQEAEAVQAAPIVMPTVHTPPASETGASQRKIWKWECRDMVLLMRAAIENPAAYLKYFSLNEKLIGAEVTNQGEKFNLPGIETWQETGMSIRRSKP